MVYLWRGERTKSVYSKIKIFEFRENWMSTQKYECMQIRRSLRGDGVVLSTVWASWQRWGAWTHRRRRQRNATPSACRSTVSYLPHTWRRGESNLGTNTMVTSRNPVLDDLLPDVSDLCRCRLLAFHLNHGKAPNGIEGATVAQQVDRAPLLWKFCEWLPSTKIRRRSNDGMLSLGNFWM